MLLSFIDPKDKDFPIYIELFSRKPDAVKLPEDAHLVHISVSEYLSSFSAILMDDEYYSYAVSHAVELNGVQAIDHDALIVLKSRHILTISSDATPDRKFRAMILTSINEMSIEWFT